MTVIAFGHADHKIASTEVTKNALILNDIARSIVTAENNIKGYQLPFTMFFVESVTPSTGEVWWSCGRDTNPELARIKAISEAIEWFSCGSINDNLLVDGSLKELGEKVIDPRKIISYLPDQSGKAPNFNPEEKYQWFPVKNITTGDEKLVLADMVFFPYFPKYGNTYAYGNSSGVAGHDTQEMAIENAILENIERDAFMVTWFNYIKREKIRNSSMPSYIRERIKNLENARFRVSVVNISYDLSPVIMVTISRESPPFLSCSTASGFDVEQTINKALMEVEASAYCHLRDGPSRKILTPREVKRTMDHGSYYENTHRIRDVEFLFGNQEKEINMSHVKEDNKANSIQDIIIKINEYGMQVLIADLTKGVEFSKLKTKVVRAIIPGMVPINFGHGIESLGTPRITSLPVKCGIFDQAKESEDLNTAPHPFT